MPSRILIKRSSTASAVPAAASLQAGELAVNLADQRLYSKTAGGTVVQVGFGNLTSGMVTTALGFTPYNSTNPSGYITASGSITGSSGSCTGNAATSASNRERPKPNLVDIKAGDRGRVGSLPNRLEAQPNTSFF